MAGKLALWAALHADVDALHRTFCDDPVRWLPRPTYPLSPGYWALVVHAGEVARTGICMVGAPVGDDAVVTRRIGWRAQPEPGQGPVQWALPPFRGALVLHAAPKGAELRLQIAYRRPAGTMGAALGLADVHKLADAAATRFLQDVATRLLAEAGG